MKKLFVLLLALLLIGTALAEDMSSIQAYLIERGLTVLDNSRYESQEDDASGGIVQRIGSYLLLSVSDGSSVIAYGQGGTMFLAIHMLGTFGGSGGSGGMADIFIDACREFEFDTYMATFDESGLIHVASPEVLSELRDQIAGEGFEACDSLDDFIEAVRSAA